MSGSFVKLWGYRADGDARLFHVPPGGSLPPGWSTNISVISDPKMRDGTLICFRAGRTVDEPEIYSGEPAEQEQSADVIQVREHWKTRQKREREEAAAAEKPLRYDENLQQVGE